MADRPLWVKIVLPFAGLHILVVAVTGVVVVSALGRQVQGSLDARAARACEVLAGSGFAWERDFLEHVKGVTGAEVVALDRSGGPVASTLTDEATEMFVARAHPREGERSGQEAGGGLRLGEESYRYTVCRAAQAESAPGWHLAVLVPATRMHRLQRQVALTLAAVGLLGVLAVSVLGARIARSVSAPVSELTVAAETVAHGGELRELPVSGRDEVGRLADAFNRMSRSLERAQGELARSARLAAAGRIAAGLAHEIRNPLSSIGMLVQLVRERAELPDRDREALETVLVETERLETVVRNLLDLAKPRAPENEDLDLRQVVEHVVKIAQPKLASRDQRVEVAQASCSTVVRGDPTQLGQVLLNLVLNASESMGGGGRIEMAFESAGPGSVRVLIEDTGPGVDPAAVEAAFEPFTTTKPEGVGLGLFVSRRIAEEHGGSVRLEPGELGGARAVLELPAVEP